MRAQLSLEVLISLALAFAIMLFALSWWGPLGSRLSTLAQVTKGYASGAANLTDGLESGYACFSFGQVSS